MSTIAINKGESFTILIKLPSEYTPDVINSIKVFHSSGQLWFQPQREADGYFIRLSPNDTLTLESEFHIYVVTETSIQGRKVSQWVKISSNETYVDGGSVLNPGIDAIIDVSINGSISSWVAQFIKGDKGEAGPAGTRGETGSRGPKGNSITGVNIVGNTLVFTFDGGMPPVSVIVPAIQQAIDSAAAAAESANDAAQSLSEVLIIQNDVTQKRDEVEADRQEVAGNTSFVSSALDEVRNINDNVNAKSSIVDQKAIEVSEDRDAVQVLRDETELIKNQTEDYKDAASIILDDVLGAEGRVALLEQETEGHRDDAAQSASEAKSSEDNAKLSELAAKASELAAKLSEDAAKLSEDNAKDSELAAAASALAAAASEMAAAASALDAANQAQFAQAQVALCVAELNKCIQQVTLATNQFNLAKAEADRATTQAAAAAASASQSSSAAGTATQVSFGGATGIDGVQATASIRSLGRVLDGWSYSRAGTDSTLFSRQGLLNIAQPHQPRFFNNPFLPSGLGNGLYISGAVPQLMRRAFSETNTPNTLTNVTHSLSASNEPTFGRRFQQLRETTTNAGHSFQFGNIDYTRVQNNTYTTYTFFRQVGQLRELLISFNANGTVRYNPTTKTVTATDGSTTAASVVELPNGIIRIRTVYIASSASTIHRLGIFINQLGAISTYAGDINTGVDVFGHMLFDGNVVVDEIIPSEATAVTKTADSAAMDLTRYRQSGTFIVRARAVNDVTQAIFVANDGTTNNQLRLQANGTLTYTLGGVTQTLNTGGDTTAFSVWVITYTPTRVAISRNGGAVQSITVTGNIPVTNINANPDSATSAKVIDVINYIPSAITDAGMIVRSNPNLFYGLKGSDLTLNADLGEMAFRNVSDAQRIQTPVTIPFLGTGASVTHTFRLPFDSIVRLVFLPSGSYSLTSGGSAVVVDNPGVTAGSTLLASANIAVTFNVPVNNYLVLQFLPVIT